MSSNRKGRIQAKEDGEDATLRLSPERQEKRARNVLLHQLNRSVKSKDQLRKILAKREIDVEIAERILDRFEEAGLINDREFAITVVNSRHRHKGLAKSAIARELREKGIEQPILEEALADIDSEAELSRAKELAEVRARRLVSLEPEVAKRRLSGYLARKGYSGNIVHAATNYGLSQAVKSEV